MTRSAIITLAAAAALSVSALAISAPALAAGGGHGGTGKKVTASESYLPMDTLTATVAQDYSLRGVLQIDAGLEIADPQLRARAEALRPRLRDAYAAALAAYAGGIYRPGAAPDAAMIGDMLQDATDRTLGQDGADFLLGMVIVH